MSFNLILKISCLIFSLFVAPTTTLLAQAKSQIELVRERYYSVTNDLSKLQIIGYNDRKYYLDDNTIKIVKENYDGGDLEFYLTPDELGYKIYFIFLDRKEKQDAPDLRIYLDESEGVFLIKENQQELSYHGNINIINAFILKGKNAINDFYNLYEISKNHKQDQINEIINQATAIVQNIRHKIDTVNYEKVADGGFFEQGEFNYLNSEGMIIKRMSFNAGEHGSSWSTSYLLNNRKICKVDEGVSWAPFFNYSAKVTYYRRGRLIIREDTYSSNGVEVARVKNKTGLFRYEVDGIVPQIEYKK